MPRTLPQGRLTPDRPFLDSRRKFTKEFRTPWTPPESSLLISDSKPEATSSRCDRMFEGQPLPECSFAIAITFWSRRQRPRRRLSSPAQPPGISPTRTCGRNAAQRPNAVATARVLCCNWRFAPPPIPHQNCLRAHHVAWWALTGRTTRSRSKRMSWGGPPAGGARGGGPQGDERGGGRPPPAAPGAPPTTSLNSGLRRCSSSATSAFMNPARRPSPPPATERDTLPHWPCP